MSQPILDPRHPFPTPGRRRLLRAATALPLLPLLPLTACTGRPVFASTFLQVWRSHLELGQAEWHQRLKTVRALGCGEIVIQWAAMDGEQPWEIPEALLDFLFDDSGQLGLGIRLGLPYDERWWQALGAPDAATLPRFLAQTRARSVAYAEQAKWPRRSNFSGWYIPYELEQHNWGTPQRQALLVPWLQSIASATSAGRTPQPAISTYYSRLPSSGTLEELWAVILDQVVIRPMIQDGVGVNGLDNYQALAPLLALLRTRETSFDLIVELFQELPSQDATSFKAVSAGLLRLQRQLAIARQAGGQQLVAFALDPWVIGESPQAKQLLEAWRELSE